MPRGQVHVASMCALFLAFIRRGRHNEMESAIRSCTSLKEAGKEERTQRKRLGKGKRPGLCPNVTLPQVLQQTSWQTKQHLESRHLLSPRSIREERLLATFGRRSNRWSVSKFNTRLDATFTPLEARRPLLFFAAASTTPTSTCTARKHLLSSYQLRISQIAPS